jgi:hypothetical protein
MSSSKVGKILGFLVVAVILGGLFGWWVSHQGGSMPTMPAIANSSNGTNGSSSSSTAGQGNKSVAEVLNAPIKPGEMISNVTEAVPEEPQGWSEKLDAVILGPEDENKKADKIIALMKTAPPEVQVEYSQHLINFVQDDNYGGAAGILTNATTPSGVSTVLMNDLLNRNNNLKLPMLLAVARTDDHPLKNDAKEMIELFVQEDHGTNWEDWSGAIDKWLKENPQ